MTHRHAQPYALRYDEFGRAGFLSAPTIAGLLQESAIDGSAAAGFPFSWYLRAGSFWVIRRIWLRMDQPLPYGEPFSIETWVSTVRRTSSTREYAFVRQRDGAHVVRARILWVYVDARTGAPHPLPAEIREGFGPTGDVEDLGLDLPERFEEAPRAIATFGVRDSELDGFGHVRCGRVIAWIDDALAASFPAAAAGARDALGDPVSAAYDIEMLAPAGPADAVQVSHHKCVDAQERAFTVFVTGPDERPLARATTRPTCAVPWHPRFRTIRDVSGGTRNGAVPGSGESPPAGSIPGSPVDPEPVCGGAS